MQADGAAREEQYVLWTPELGGNARQGVSKEVVTGTVLSLDTANDVKAQGV